MLNINKVNKYARDIVSGKIDACLYVKQACQRHLDDLEKSKNNKNFIKLEDIMDICSRQWERK